MHARSSGPSPTPVVNFWRLPEVHDRDEFWERKYTHGEDERPVAVPAGGAEDHAEVGHHDEHGWHDPDGNHIHMPHPSYWPIVATLAFFPLGYGVIYRNAFLLAVAGVVMLVGFFGWIIEPVAEGDDDDDGHGGDHAPSHEPGLAPATH